MCIRDSIAPFQPLPPTRTTAAFPTAEPPVSARSVQTASHPFAACREWIFLYVQILDVLGVGLDVFAARRDLVAHEHGKHLVGGDGVGQLDAQKLSLIHI